MTCGICNLEYGVKKTLRLLGFGSESLRISNFVIQQAKKEGEDCIHIFFSLNRLGSTFGSTFILFYEFITPPPRVNYNKVTTVMQIRSEFDHC